MALIKHSQPNKVNKSYSVGRTKAEVRLKFQLLNALNPTPFQNENLYGVPVKEAETERERENGETDPEGRREQCDKTWLSFAIGNYLHANATPGKPRGSMEKDEDQRLKKHFFLKGVEIGFVILLAPRLDKDRQGKDMDEVKMERDRTEDEQGE